MKEGSSQVTRPPNEILITIEHEKTRNSYMEQLDKYKLQTNLSMIVKIANYLVLKQIQTQKYLTIC